MVTSSDTYQTDNGTTLNASTVRPRADVICSEVPCVITDPSRVERLIVEVKTSDALSASNLEYFTMLGHHPGFQWMIAVGHPQ